MGWGAAGQDGAAPPSDARAQRGGIPAPTAFLGFTPIPVLLGDSAARTTTQDEKPDPPGWHASRKPLGFAPKEVFPADARGWGRRPAVREPRVLHPCSGFCETGLERSPSPQTHLLGGRAWNLGYCFSGGERWVPKA